jgi:HAD superfamily hydrolase (TIGR01509 family)
VNTSEADAQFPAIQLVIFDCDGTLVDSEPLSCAVLAECAREQGIDISAEDSHARFKGARMADCVRELESMLGSPLPATFIEDAKHRQNLAFAERLKPIEGAVELLRAMHLPYCMGSNGPRAKMELTLGTTGLLHFFKDNIFSAYEVGSWKPEPELFLHAARHYGIAPEHCAVIEDSLPGILAGVAAGMQVFALKEPGVPELPNIPEGVVRIDTLYHLQEYLIAPHRRTVAPVMAGR